MDKKERENNLPSSQRPRSPRVPVNFVIELEGVADSGKSFKAPGEAIRVSRGGATVVTDAPAAVGTVVSIKPPFGGSLQAEVNGVWIDNTDGKQRIGIKLLDA